MRSALIWWLHGFTDKLSYVKLSTKPISQRKKKNFKAIFAYQCIVEKLEENVVKFGGKKGKLL